MKYVACLVTTGADSYATSPSLCFRKPTEAGMLAALNAVVERAMAKHNGYLALELREPFRPRSTGPKSQSNHLHGHIAQLADELGYTMGEMKQIVKEETPTWPVTYREFRGKRRAVYASEADVSVEVESAAIEMTHRIAADMGITLREEEA